MSEIETALKELQKIAGFVAAALGHADSGMSMGSVSLDPRFSIETAVATNTEVVKAKLKAMHALGLDDAIEDILITLHSQHHIIHPIASNPSVFFYLALDRASSNLALARFKLAEVEKKFTL